MIFNMLLKHWFYFKYKLNKILLHFLCHKNIDRIVGSGYKCGEEQSLGIVKELNPYLPKWKVNK